MVGGIGIVSDDGGQRSDFLPVEAEAVCHALGGIGIHVPVANVDRLDEHWPGC